LIIVRRSEERRQIEKKDQTTWMTFDSENKSDPLQNGFGMLKILNEEILPPGNGFILHTHKAMVIVTYVLEGMVVYKSPLGKPDLVETKEFHRVNLTPEVKQQGFGVLEPDNAHFFQSGFTNSEKHLEQDGIKKLFTQAERKGILKLVASPDGRGSSLSIQQDVQIYSTFINKGNHMIHELLPGRSAWLHVVKGEVQMNQFHLQTGDGSGLTDERSVSFTAQNQAEILLFDLGKQTQEVPFPFSNN